jgi:hypothetical protein
MKALALAACLALGFAACNSMQPTANTTEVQFVLAKAPA